MLKFLSGNIYTSKTREREKNIEQPAEKKGKEREIVIS
jgi:hypothetical protein